MTTKQPIDPFENNNINGLRIVIILLVFLLPGLVSFSGFQRKNLIARAQGDDVSSGFVIDEIYNKTDDIDVLIIGPCTAWWQIYTPLIKKTFSEKENKNLNVISIGFNHFGSDLIYLILKDVLENRRVHKLVLTLPKTEDLKPFPHVNAPYWWIYPRDISHISGLSIAGHIKLYGLSVFTAIPRLLDKVNIENRQYTKFGFNENKVEHLLTDEQLDRFVIKSYSQIKKLNQVAIASRQLENDWLVFYKAIANLVEKNKLKIVFVDSPHTSDFSISGDLNSWGYEKYFNENASVIKTDFGALLDSLPLDLKNKFLIGQNLSPLGAQIFTKSILEKLHEALYEN